MTADGLYLEHYQLSSRPFDIAPTPSALLDTTTHREALATLMYGLTHGHAFVVLTGEVGTGKTTLLMAARNSVRSGQLHVINLLDPGLRRDDFVESLASELGCPPNTRNLNLIRDALGVFAAHGRRVVLVVDEAQNLPQEMFDLLRYLTNLQGDKGPLLQVILVGQPELLEMLKQPALRSLRQRVTNFALLSPLTTEESVDYIMHRIRVAGAEPDDVMTRGATRLLAAAGHGLPRRLNVLCDHALLAGYGRDVRRVDRAIAQVAIHEMDGVKPTRRRPVLAGLLLVTLVLGALGAAWRLSPNWCQDVSGLELTMCNSLTQTTNTSLPPPPQPVVPAQ